MLCKQTEKSIKKSIPYNPQGLGIGQIKKNVNRKIVENYYGFRHKLYLGIWKEANFKTFPELPNSLEIM